MTNYDEINARKLAERRPPDPNRHFHEHEPLTRANLDEVERLAAELHQRWEARDFPHGVWLKVEDTEKLALLLKWTLGGLESLECDFSHDYLMIDGRLAYYKVTNKCHPQFAVTRRIKDWQDIQFCTYREYIEEGLAQGRDMFGTTNLTLKRLAFMMGRF